MTQLVDAGIRLAVTPQVSANRMITMSIRAENSSASQATSDGNPLINRQEATNQLLVADGETAVIGGLTVTTVQLVRTGIPYLKDLPFIGALFRRQSRQEEKRDLLLLITPHILDGRLRATQLFGQRGDARLRHRCLSPGGLQGSLQGGHLLLRLSSSNRAAPTCHASAV